MNKPFDRRPKSNCWQPFLRQQQVMADMQAKLFIQGQLLKENAAYADRILQSAVYLAVDLAPVLAKVPEEERAAWVTKIIHNATMGIQIQSLERLYEEAPESDFVEQEQETEEQEWS